MKRLTFTVTNDLLYDQRMIRICTSLQNAGYIVTLVGRSSNKSKALLPQSFRQKRIFCIASKGKSFYIEYNIKLFFFLLFQKMDLIGAIDLDTIVPCLWTSKIRAKKRLYDAHELFCEMKEVVSRPAIYKIWKQVERKTVPQYQYGYTVNQPIKNILQKEYGVDYEVIRNMPLLKKESFTINKEQPYILYQGAVNEGRSFETLIPAFQWIDMPLWICGDGNFLEQAVELVKHYHLEHKVIFKGKIMPQVLPQITAGATLGITLFENNGLSNYYSLANRFFDYMHAGTPQLCVDYPVYRDINNRFKVAVLISDLSLKSIAAVINETIHDETLLQDMRHACMQAREVYNWQAEEKKLISYYQKVFANNF